MDSSLYAKIRASACYCRDIPTRKKLNVFLDAIRFGDVRKACRKHGVIPKTYYFWWKRFVQGGFKLNALQCLSRRPKHSPRKIGGKKLRWIRHYRIQFHYGPERIQMYLRLNHSLHVAQSTIQKVIQREKLILRKNKKLPVNKHTKRYSLPWPGDCLQMDIKYVPYKMDGEQYYVFNAIDDCSRWRISRLYRNKGIMEAIRFLKFVHKRAPFKIKKIQLDNDTSFTYRLNPNAFDKRHPFESTAEELEIKLKFIPPGEKELQGKVERLHRTDDDEFFWKAPKHSFSLLQEKLNQWTLEYNYFRHHKTLDWKRPKDILEEKFIEQKEQMTYTDINPPSQWKWAVIYQQKKRTRPKYHRWMERYLGYLDWKDSHPLPVTNVSGYHMSKLRQAKFGVVKNFHHASSTTIYYGC